VRKLNQIEDDGNKKNPTNRTKRPKDDARGGGEVYDMFNARNHCVLNDEMISHIENIASEQSKTNYWQYTRGGTMHQNEVVKDIQRYMDAYYNSKKFDFPKKLYPDAYDMMEVYIKTMYLIERGLLQRISKNDGSPGKVNILWGDMQVDKEGTFRSFICI
jgi:hypothetical protein